MMTETKETIRPTTPEAIQLAKTLLRTSRHGAIAVLLPETGRPSASRVALATDTDGTPIILVSGLANHTPSIIANPACSLLAGDPGKGDPMAHARVTLYCQARQIRRDDEDYTRIRRRYLNHNPKGKLYVDLGDFSFFRLEVEGASLNGGFGKAFILTPADLICDPTISAEIEAVEQGALDHMNEDHANAVTLYATHYAKRLAEARQWTMIGIDPDGFDLAAGDEIARIFFEAPLNSPNDVHRSLVDMARNARLAS